MKSTFLLKVFFFLCLIVSNVWFSNFSFAIDEDEEVLWIESITYDGYLSDETIIDINWLQLEECSDIYIDWKPIFIVWKTDTKISFNYSSVSWPVWYWELRCSTENIKFFYTFPYIDSTKLLNIEDFKRRVQINGSNLWKKSTVAVEWSSFDVSVNTQNLIIWSLAKDINQTSLYVEVDWLKSNKIDLKLTIPKVHFAYAPDWFYPQKTLFIWGDNMNNSLNTELYINEEKYQYSIDPDTQSIKALLNRKPWDYKVSVENNGIMSNSLDITVLWDKPIIKKWFKWNYKVNDEDAAKNAFTLDMVDVKWDIEWITIWHNGKSHNVIHTEWNKLFIDTIKLTKWKNYFYVDSYGSFSDVYVLDNWSDDFFPFVRNITFDWFNDDKSMRVVRVDVWYFDIDTDTIYLWQSKVTPERCLGNVCTFLLSADILEGAFNVEREWIMSIYPQTFDIRPANVAYIKGVSLLWKEKGNKIKVLWNNFYWGKFSDWDLFFHNNKENAVYKVTRNSIVWKLENSLVEGVDYSIWFTQYGFSVNNSFTLDDFDWKDSIIFPALVLSAWNKNEVFAWEEIKIQGFGFWPEDLISIWWNTLNFTKVTWVNNSIWYIQIPEYFPLGTFDLKVKNASGKFSKPLSLTILPPRDDVSLHITSQWGGESFYQNETLNWSTLYNVSIWKLYSDIIVKKIAFTLSWIQEKDINSIGTFVLYLNGRQVWYTNINTSWEIIFDTPFEIGESKSEQKLELRKKSPFTYDWKFSIQLDSSQFSFHSKKSQLSLEAQFKNISAHSFMVMPQKFIKCIQAQWISADICKRLWSESWLNHSEIIQESIKNLETQDTVTTIGSWYKWEVEKTAILLSNFQQWHLYVKKVQEFLPNVRKEKLVQAQQKLRVLDISRLSQKPMFEALVYFLKASIDYEISIR